MTAPCHFPRAFSSCRAWGKPGERIDRMEHVRLGVHIWVSVLIMGTLWRLLTLHLAASDNESLTHLGRAMSLQY